MSFTLQDARPLGQQGDLPLPPGYPAADERGCACLGAQRGLVDIAMPIEIGLVNNMPDAALEATERQFLSLLLSAAGDIDVRVHFFALADVPRGRRAEQHLSLCYDDLDALLKSRLDAVIVTGSEPTATQLSDEPYWHSLVRLFDWAEANTLSTLFSCLSAHAAVLHFDGIERTQSPRKYSGVFDHVALIDHPLTSGVPGPWPVAHSRWNGLSEEALCDAGYTILSRSTTAGVNLFVRQRQSLLVLFQGHPEYEPDSLFREYRRDVRRFLSGEQATYPEIPEGCLKAATKDALLRFRKSTHGWRVEALMEKFPGVAELEEARLARAGRGSATLFANWLHAIADAKLRRWGAAMAPFLLS
ncbi:MAG: homoserine O-succinyltransferase MetA [Acetobacteraceae bacterium]